MIRGCYNIKIASQQDIPLKKSKKTWISYPYFIFFLIQEREVRAHSGIKMGALDEDISGRVKNLEEKFRGGPAPGMKPKDLYRAIGKW